MEMMKTYVIQKYMYALVLLVLPTTISALNFKSSLYISSLIFIFLNVGNRIKTIL